METKGLGGQTTAPELLNIRIILGEDEEDTREAENSLLAKEAWSLANKELRAQPPGLVCEDDVLSYPTPDTWRR